MDDIKIEDISSLELVDIYRDVDEFIKYLEKEKNEVGDN